MNQLQFEQEQAIAVGVNLKGSRPLLSMEDSLSELKLLADTAGMAVVGQITQNVGKIDAATFVGSGKVEEIKDALLGTGAKTVRFDDELSPRHQRELEEVFGEEVKVLDRSALILDIFAQHAKTREGALQVELAQYEYRLPRLTRMWTHLARQAGGGGGRSGNGGVGLRGPGETQLEVDRRDIRRRISKLKEDLEHVREHRSRHRTQRERTGVPLVALVGYTNAGKSTLLRALTGADVYIANQLFATLDPTTRRTDLPSGRQALITDTVGFIQKLPTTLIAAFQATLEEIKDADVILVVADVNHPNVLQHLETVEDTLAEIDVPPVPRVLVWNKVDQWKGDKAELPKPENAADYVAQVAVSATQNIGLEKLLGAVETALKAALQKTKLLIPYERGDLVSLLHETASVEKQEHTEGGVLLTLKLPQDMHERFKAYRV
ncbi:MAG: GTPase HflX [Chloroflexi bacterium]|uniref:GTPase HflX n=1 Tax=Candidatus Flexifilum breve TaxID=3140694 RepID=UPI003136D145|nr:GTPase HflX [Chloroflexota bacterium]